MALSVVLTGVVVSVIDLDVQDDLIMRNIQHDSTRLSVDNIPGSIT